VFEHKSVLNKLKPLNVSVPYFSKLM